MKFTIAFITNEKNDITREDREVTAAEMKTGWKGFRREAFDYGYHCSLGGKGGGIGECFVEESIDEQSLAERFPPRPNIPINEKELMPIVFLDARAYAGFPSMV